jgi:hypothetical protein
MTWPQPLRGSGHQGNGDGESEHCMDAESAGVHDQGMDVAYISALSALAGSVVGGLTSGITTWLSLRAQARAGQHAHDKSLREDLYKDFVVAASKAYGDAITSNDPQIQEIVALYAMINRMRILSSPRIVACADEILQATLATYFAPNKTIRELHDLMKNGGGEGLDLLKDFSENAREELRTF